MIITISMNHTGTHIFQNCQQTYAALHNSHPLPVHPAYNQAHTEITSKVTVAYLINKEITTFTSQSRKNKTKQNIA